jgi:electron transfer flavoprotein alpha subunit
MTDRIVVVAEQEEGRIAPITLELLKTGAELSQHGGDAVCACIIGYGVGHLADELAYYVGEVYVIDDPLLSGFQADLYSSALEALCCTLAPRTVLMGHTYDSLELAPKLACKMGNDLVTDCVKIEREKGTGFLLCTKPIYGGNAVSVLELATAPQMVTVRPKVAEALEKGRTKGEIIPFCCELVSSMALTESLGLVPGEETVSLTQANAIVAGGRGVKTIEGIQQLQGLVEVLKRYFVKVELGASRPLVDEGLLSRSRQIGQTGEKVNPQLYIAVAISGAAQHMAGAGGSKKIVTINKDAEAAIFGASDYGIVGQYEDVVPAFIKKLATLS